MQKVCTQLGRYEDLATVRLKQSIEKTNNVETWRDAGTRRVNTVNMDASIALAEQAAQLYGQVFL